MQAVLADDLAARQMLTQKTSEQCLEKAFISNKNPDRVTPVGGSSNDTAEP